MKKIFFTLIFMYSYIVYAQSKVCVSVSLVGTNIEVSIRETNNTPFLLGVSDIYVNTGGLGYTYLSNPIVVKNVNSGLPSAYSVDVFGLSPDLLAINIQNNNTSFSIGSTSLLVVSIPISGSGTPSILFPNNIYSTTSAKITEYCEILSVELISFNDEKKGEKVAIQWDSHNEKGLLHYAVERSSDGMNFKTIDIEKPIAKNETEKVAYSFIDEKPELGINYYRLQIKDLNGNMKYSKVASVDFGSKMKARTYPNPFSTDLSIEIDIEKNIKGDVVIDLLDMTGKIVQTKKMVAEGRKVSFNLLTVDLTPGTYVIRMKNGNDTWQQKITKQ